MASAFDIEGKEFRRLDMLAWEAFELGKEFEARQGNLKQEFNVRLSQLIASFTNDADLLKMTSQNCDSLDEEMSLAKTRESMIAPPIKTFVTPTPGSSLISPTWTALRAAFFEDKPGLANKTLCSYNQAFDIWEGLIGSKLIKDIRRPELKLFADHLRSKPNLRGGHLNYKSIERSLGHIKNFMTWAVRAGYVQDDRFETVKGRDKTQEERLCVETRRAFTADELQILFNNSLFRSSQNEAKQAEAWFLVIAALTGARAEEIEEAPSTLIKLGEVWCLDLRKAGTKTRAAPRLVPVLPDLLRLGLLDWSAKQAKLGRRLVQPGPNARTAAAWSKALNRFINKHVADSPDLVLHSLRHNFRQTLRAANIGDELANKIFGHNMGAVGAKYGKDLSIHEAALVFRAVQSPVDLSHLSAWF